MIRSFLLASAFAVCAIGCPTVSVAQAKIGAVQTERILRDSPAALKVAKKIQLEFEKRRADVKALADRISELQKSIEKDGLIMPESERRSKDREITALTREYQRAQRELQEDFDLRSNQEVRGLAERADKIIRKIASDEGFDLIVQDPVFASPKIDLTERVIKAMGE